MKALHLYNIFGALTERSMLGCTLGIAARQHELSVGYETLAPEAPSTRLPLHALDRIAVESEGDIDRQMADIASRPRDPKLARLLDEPFDLVHGHFGPRLLQAAAFLDRRAPVVISLYGYDVGRLLRDEAWVQRYRWGARHGVVFVALSGQMHQRLLDLGIPRNSLRFITLGINLSEHAFAPAPRPSEPRFAIVGRLVEKKGTQYALRALAELPADLRSRATLDVIGAGPLDPSLRQLAAELGISNQVRFLGTLPFDQLLPHVRHCTALLQPSVTASDGDTEGAPMTLMHAQAIGVPCITTDHAGNPDVLPPAASRFIVPERDPIALSIAMQQMIALSPADRLDLQHAGRAWIETHYNIEKTASGYDGLYRSLARRVA